MGYPVGHIDSRIVSVPVRLVYSLAKMKGDEIELFVQPLLDSRTGAYIEWLDKELIMTANNNINKDSLLALLSA